MSAHDWVTIAGEGVELEAIVTRGSADAIGIICHPHPLYGGDMHNPVVRALEHGLQRAGWSTLRFNFRGVGESTGQHTHGPGELDDVAAVICFALAGAGERRLLLAGYSFGAAIALQAATRAPHPGGVIAVAPPLAMMPAPASPPAQPQRFVVGSHDPYCSVAQAQLAVAAFPEMRTLELFDGADHFLHGHADALTAIAARFATEMHAAPAELAVVDTH